ncbi:MAG: MnhB domain-containing protein [Thermoplasmata archaeon]
MNWEMSKIVRTITDIMVVPIIVFGIYLIVHGHLTPGGGFQGGAVIASSTALLIIAYGSFRDYKEDFSSLESVGLTLFIILAILGLLLSTTMFYNFAAGMGGIFGGTVSQGINPGYINTGGTVPLMNIMVGLEVAAALSLILWMMAKNSDSMEVEI